MHVENREHFVNLEKRSFLTLFRFFVKFYEILYLTDSNRPPVAQTFRPETEFAHFFDKTKV